MDHDPTVRSAKAFEAYDLGAEGQAGLFAFPTITSGTAAIQQNAFRRHGGADLADQPEEVNQAMRLIAAAEAQEDAFCQLYARLSPLGLTRRQVEALYAMSLRESDTETGRRLGIAPATVRRHRQEAMSALKQQRFDPNVVLRELAARR